MLLKSETIKVSSAPAMLVDASPAWEEFPEFFRFKEEANSKYVGWLDPNLAIPCCEGLIGKAFVENLFIIPGTNNMWEGGDGIYWNTRVLQFAHRHNAWLRQTRGE